MTLRCFLHNQKIGFSMSKAMYMSKAWVYVCTICWIFSHLNTICNSKATDAIIPLFLHNKTSVTAPIFLHNKKSDFPCQKQCMFKDGLYICMICWNFSHFNTACKSKATDAIIPLFLHNKTSVTRRYFFIIKNRTVHVKNNVCLKCEFTFVWFIEFFRTWIQHASRKQWMRSYHYFCLHNKTSVTRRYFCIIKNRTFHVKNNICLKS